MSLTLLATGTLLRDPVARTSAAGKQFCTALMRVPGEGEDAVLCSLIAFHPDAVRSILALSNGDAIAVSGLGKLTSWTKDGEEKHGLGVTVEAVLTAYQIDKKRQQTKKPAPETAP